MRFKRVFTVVGLLVTTTASVIGQSADWRRLVALDATRADVEKILGKPDTHFESYGLYKTPLGKFSVWYSKGGCTRKGQGLRYNVPDGKMTQLYLALNKAGALIDYLPKRAEDYLRTVSPLMGNRYHYSSADNSEVIGTIQRNDGSEFVNSVSIHASDKYQNLLCAES